MKVWNGDGRLRKPAKGATLMGMLGWKEVGIAKQGIFKVQEVTKHSGPAVFDIGAEAAALDKTLKTQKNRNWKPPKTYGDIFNQLASDNGLSPAVHGSISQLKVGKVIAQHGESDMHFATRLARSVGKIGFDAEVKAENPQAKEEMWAGLVRGFHTQIKRPSKGPLTKMI